MFSDFSIEKLWLPSVYCLLVLNLCFFEMLFVMIILGLNSVNISPLPTRARLGLFMDNRGRSLRGYSKSKMPSLWVLMCHWFVSMPAGSGPVGEGFIGVVPADQLQFTCTLQQVSWSFSRLLPQGALAYSHSLLNFCLHWFTPTVLTHLFCQHLPLDNYVFLWQAYIL